MNDENIEQLTHLLSKEWDDKKQNLLQILIGLQYKLHFIPAESIQFLSKKLNIEPVEIKAVIEFYSFLQTEPPIKYTVLFSDNIIEQQHGSRELAQQLADQLNIKIGGSQQSNLVRIDFTSCIGLSDQAPAAMVNGLSIASLNETKINQIAALIEQHQPIQKWPKSLFEINTNIRQLLLLNQSYVLGAAIQQALRLGPQNTITNLDQSGLRGCGGAGFSTAKKWQFCMQAKQKERVVVCNADEGEPGTFKDRVLLQKYANQLIEGMTVCATTIGATLGFIYLRSEYRFLLVPLKKCLEQRRDKGLLGHNILNKQSFNFDIEIHLGAGAYICGEESALIESLEGKRGIPRIRPPFPVTSGYINKPTVVNNVETFVLAGLVTLHGAGFLNSLGTTQSKGTKLLSISGDCQQPGIYEVEFGSSIQSILKICGATDVQAVQVGGAAGELILASDFDRQLAYEDIATGGSFMIFNQSRNILKAIHNFTQFFVHESCGFCTPCRIGNTVLASEFEKIVKGHASPKALETIQQVGELMQQTSHCGLGQTAANTLLNSIKQFPLLYSEKIELLGQVSGFDLEASLKQSKQLLSNESDRLNGGEE
ncbi:MAG: NAD(P)H-dependent oxidoreductase subunit E [Gammaproteobacteria bacterium]|nr:NAD(P)H-dependent oxidoreductase subunit E [Gammaproteobacteria bacterium]